MNCMKIKQVVGMGLILGVAGIGQEIRANSIVLNQNGYSFADGGEFQAVTSSPQLLDGYSPAALVGGGFETFCVEASVYFNPGATYSFTLANTDSQGRALSLGAAFLYQQFATGVLAGYDYGNSANRQIDAGMLQSALWFLQGNQSGGGAFPNGGAGNFFYNYAVTNLGAANVSLANNGAYSVEIVQLWDDAGNTHQNQLVFNPPTPPSDRVPEGGLTILMLAMGMASIAVAKFALRKPQTEA